MKRKIFIYGAVFACMCASLTGCSIQLDDGDIETFQKIKDSTNITVNGKNINLDDVENSLSDNDEYYEDNNPPTELSQYYNEDCKVQVSYMDLGNSHYLIIYGLDDNGNTTWTYETEKVITDYDSRNILTEYLGDYKEEFAYVLDNGCIKIFNIEDGKEVFSSEKKYQNNLYVGLNGENGNVVLLYGKKPEGVLILDKKGKQLADINLKKNENIFADGNYYAWDSEVDSNHTELYLGKEDPNDLSGNHAEKEWMLNIDFNKLTADLKEIKEEKVTEKMINGKSLMSDYDMTIYFEKDGTFSWCYPTECIDKYSTLREYGTWKLENDELVLKFNEKVIAVGGYYENDEDGFRHLVDYDEKTETAEREERSIIKYYPDYMGEEFITIDENRFYITEPIG